MSDANYTNSSLRSMLIEHLILGAVLKKLWQKRVYDVTILRPEVDSSGYDLVMECQGRVSCIQVKSAKRTAVTRSVNIHKELANRPGGCVIWILFDEPTFDLGPFYWLSGQKLRDALDTAKVAIVPGKKSERPKLRQIPRSKFEKLDCLDAIVGKLFNV